MTTDQAVDQFFFEHYVNKYIQVIKDHGWNIQGESLRPYRFILEGLSLVALSVEPSSANKLRAKLLMITTDVIQLQELLNEESLDDLSEDTLVDICHDIHTLLTAVQNITQYVPSFKFKAIYNKCLIQLNSLWEQATTQPDHLNLSSLNELWSVLRELVCQAAQFMEDPNECSCQLLQRMKGEQVGEWRCSLSYLQEIMGKGPEESDDEEEIRALQDKFHQRKMKRHKSSDSSEGQVTPQGVRQMENGSLASIPKEISVISAQEQGAGTTSMMIAVSDFNSSDSEENHTYNWKSHQNSTDTRKYPILPDVKPRDSLLNFTRKPPSHSKGKPGRWLLNEEEEFILKTIQIGEGKWAEIKTAMKSARSSVQLKDKWRQISLSRVEKVARQYRLKYVGSKQIKHKPMLE